MDEEVPDTHVCQPTPANMNRLVQKKACNGGSDTHGVGGAYSLNSTFTLPKSDADSDSVSISPVSSCSSGVTPKVVLIWDGPNIDMGLGTLIGSRPAPEQRPRFDALGKWLLQQTQQLIDGSEQKISHEPDACVFTNILPANTDSMRPWVEALRNVGYSVFAKPKVHEDSDVDDAMLACIKSYIESGTLAALYVASADGRAFKDLLLSVADAGIPVTVIGFQEHVFWTQGTPIKFFDLENIPGVFRSKLPRIGLDNLPAEGAWLRPFRPLSGLLDSGI